MVAAGRNPEALATAYRETPAAVSGEPAPRAPTSAAASGEPAPGAPASTSTSGGAADGLDGIPSNLRFAQVDLNDEASIAALAETVASVDHVVSTASARARGLLADLEPETMLLSFQTKVIGPILLAKHFASRLPADGSFVFFSGHSARKSHPGMLAVGATNGAVDVVARSLAVELAPLRVNAVSPGTIDTGAYDGLGVQGKADLFAKRVAENPSRRLGTADDVAEAVLFALTNTFLTGASLPVTDIDRAKSFYADQVGFHLDVDVTPADGVRVVQLTPPGSYCSIKLSTGFPKLEMPPGSTQNMPWRK